MSSLLGALALLVFLQQGQHVLLQHILLHAVGVSDLSSNPPALAHTHMRHTRAVFFTLTLEIGTPSPLVSPHPQPPPCEATHREMAILVEPLRDALLELSGRWCGRPSHAGRQREAVRVGEALQVRAQPEPGAAGARLGFGDHDAVALPVRRVRLRIGV